MNINSIDESRNSATERPNLSARSNRARMRKKLGKARGDSIEIFRVPVFEIQSAAATRFPHICFATRKEIPFPTNYVGLHSIRENYITVFPLYPVQFGISSSFDLKIFTISVSYGSYIRFFQLFQLYLG